MADRLLGNIGEGRVTNRNHRPTRFTSADGIRRHEEFRSLNPPLNRVMRQLHTLVVGEVRETETGVWPVQGVRPSECGDGTNLTQCGAIPAAVASLRDDWQEPRQGCDGCEANDYRNQLLHVAKDERLGSGDGERKTLLTRQIAFEPLPASVLFALGWLARSYL